MDKGQLGEMFGPRQMRNCLPCKKRKIKCDRKIPCGPCALRRDVKSCTPALNRLEEYTPETFTATEWAYHCKQWANVSGYVSSRDFQLLAQRLETLQTRVQELESAVGVGTSSSNGPVGEISATSGGDEGSPTTQARVMSRRHLGDDEMVFALEDFQMSHRINAMRNISDSPEITAARGTSGGGPADVASAPSELTDDHPLAFLVSPSTDYIGKALSLLPDQQTCELLVQQYFENVEWFQRCLHYPTFMAQCRQFWTDPPPTSQLSPDFVCTYFMVICLGLRTVVDSLPGMTNALAQADQLYHAAEGVLWCSRFLHRQTFESLQAISLMTIYGFGVEDGADATWALMGAAIKIAQNLGLNRLEAEAPDKVWSPVWGSLRKREMGRRIWWTLAALDWSHAIAHGSTYCIHPTQNLAALPLNIEDDKLDDPNARPQPLNVYTPMSMQIFRFKFVTLYRQITDHMMTHHNPSYTYILTMDDKVIELARGLPRHFEDPTQLPADADRGLVLDSIFLNVMANTRLVRLHRPYLLRGYQDARYERSKERCIQASRMILQLIELAQRRAPVLLSFWIVLFYAFSAAVPVVIDHLFEPTDAKRHSIVQLIATFRFVREYGLANDREHMPISPAARKSVYVLEQLLEVENVFREPPLGSPPTKRRRADSTSTTTTALSPGNSQQDELLRSTIRKILASAAFSEAQKGQAAPAVVEHPPVVSTGAEDGANALGLGLDDALGLGPMWGTTSFDILDSLWTQTDSAWPGQ